MINEQDLDNSLMLELRTFLLTIDFSPYTVEVLPSLDIEKDMPQLILSIVNISNNDSFVGGIKRYNFNIVIKLYDDGDEDIRFNKNSGKLLYELGQFESNYFNTDVSISSDKLSPDLHNQGIWQNTIIITSKGNK